MRASSESAPDAPTADAASREGRCFCGATRVTLAGAPIAVSICHCVNCRKLSGAPFSSQALVKADQVAVHREDGVDDLVGFASSPAVERFRCARCASPVYATLAKGKMAAVPLTIFDAADGVEPLRPTHHMYYSDRIMDVDDQLPKYVKSSGGGRAELWTGD